MSEVKLFRELTTEEALASLEADAANQEGLYVDMSESKARKYIKGQALLINGLLKKLDRARIDKAKTIKLKLNWRLAASKPVLKQLTNRLLC